MIAAGAPRIAVSHARLPSGGDESRIGRAGSAASGPLASLPCAPLATRSDTASRIATVSAAATITTAFIVLRSRCRSPRVVLQKLRLVWKIILDQAGSGIAIETLIESTVRLTITHSDNAPIASAAATASASREDATGAERPLKPAPPGDRFMAEILKAAGESPAQIEVSQESLAILRRRRLKNDETEAGWRVWPPFLPLFPHSGVGRDGRGILDFGVRAPVHRDEARGLLDPP
jgi:hypothetical protein